MISIFVIVMMISLLLSIFITTLRNGIAPTPTSFKVRKELLKQLPDETPKCIAELGSGWGTLTFALAKKYPNVPIYAYENSLLPWLFMKISLFLLPRHNINLVFKDFYEENLSKFDIIVCYLYPSAMEKLEIKFSQELQEGTSIFTHTFAIPGWSTKDCWKVNDLYKTNIYHYVK